MNVVKGGYVCPNAELPYFASAACLAIASCSTSTTASPPPARTATSTSKTAASTIAPPAPETSPLAKDWKSYGGTVYFGCPDEFSVSKSALEDIRPKVLDTKTGQFITPGIPTVPAGENHNRWHVRAVEHTRRYEGYLCDNDS